MGAAESFYKRAVSCAKYYELDPDPDIALSLSGLALVHSDKGNMKYALTLAKAASDAIAKYTFFLLIEPKARIRSSMEFNT